MRKPIWVAAAVLLVLHRSELPLFGAPAGEAE